MAGPYRISLGIKNTTGNAWKYPIGAIISKVVWSPIRVKINGGYMFKVELGGGGCGLRL
jgi:hypothetical protein